MKDYANDMSRVCRSKAAAQVNYDRLSGWYDLLAASEKPFSAMGLAMLDAASGEQILEIGSGTGHGALALAQKVGPLGHLFALDLSSKMIAVAREKVDKQRPNLPISFIQGDGAQLPCRPSSMDAVFMSFVLELFDTPEIPLVLKQVRRVLKSNGRFCVVTLDKAPGGPRVRLYEWSHALLPKFVDCRPIYARQLLRDNGFKVVAEQKEKMRGIPIEILLAQKDEI